MDNQVGAALTWWENGMETKHLKFGLNASCTVFQAELFALYRAIQLASQSGEPEVNIFSDSRSSLELLCNPQFRHHLVNKAREEIQSMETKGRKLRLFWLRAHVGTAGNERADELAKSAATSSNRTSWDYDCIPLSYVKRKIREETVRKWQDRYNTSNTGAVTKVFLPDVEQAYRIIRSTRLKPIHTQALTGHGGINEYLYRFKITDSPACECDPNKNEDVWHIIQECPRFSTHRYNIENRLNTKITTAELSQIITDQAKRPLLLQYLEDIFTVATKRNSARQPPTTSTGTQEPVLPTTPTDTTDISTQRTAVPETRDALLYFLALGELGTPGIRLKGVACFMDSNSEKLGISFCIAGRNSVSISPGLAVLLNGSTFRTSMKRSRYNALTELTIAREQCKILRTKNKTIALFEWCESKTPFAQASSVLTRLETEEHTTKVISVDAMSVGYIKGETEDRIGCIKASEKHELVIYEDRGENLYYLKPHKSPVTSETRQRDSWGYPIPNVEAQSGSERLQAKLEQDTAKKISDSQSGKESRKKKSGLSALLSAFNRITQRIPSKKKRQAETSTSSTASPTPAPGPSHNTPTRRTKADMGQIQQPNLAESSNVKDHMINAVTEYMEILKARRVVHEKTCKNILQDYHLGIENLLNKRLEEAEATIYNSDTATVLRGGPLTKHMAAYNATRGFIPLNEEKTEQTGVIKYKTPQDDPIVVLSRYTKILLDGNILNTADIVAGQDIKNKDTSTWNIPKISWINGVPGCGKTTWIINRFEIHNDLIITSTTEAANDLKERLSHHIGAEAKTRVRTMASLLVNGVRDSDKVYYKRILIDEALMNHSGAIVLAMRIVVPEEVILIGDINQLPFIDRENLFKLRYSRPTLFATINEELLRTHRSPLDVAYALKEIYSGVYSSNKTAQSLSIKSYTGSEIEKTLPDTLYITYTQKEKEDLTKQGYGTGNRSKVLTIHEAQGLTSKKVAVIRATRKKLQLHNSIQHAVVAISRHTVSCNYYTDDSDDALGRFIKQAIAAGPGKIIDYNIKMAIRKRDEDAIQELIRIKSTN